MARELTLEVEGIDDLVIVGPVGPGERGVVARIEWTSMDQELAEDYARLFKDAPALADLLREASNFMEAYGRGVELPGFWQAIPRYRAFLDAIDGATAPAHEKEG